MFMSHIPISKYVENAYHIHSKNLKFYVSWLIGSCLHNYVRAMTMRTVTYPCHQLMGPSEA